MADVGLPDTLANRERAKIEIFRAKADALLAVGERWPLIDRRQNALTASTLPEEERPLASFEQEVVPQAVDRAEAKEITQPAQQQEPEAPPHDLPITPANEINGGTSPDPESSTASTVAPEKAAALTEAEPHASASATEVGETRPVLRLADFEAEYKRLRKNKGENWTEETAKDAYVLVATLRDVLEEHGVTHSGEIRQHHIAALRQHFNDVPTKYGQSAHLRTLKPTALRAFAATQRALAEQRGEPPYPVGLSAATIRKHLGNLDTFLRHLRASGYAIGEWELRDLRPAKPKAGTIRLQQIKPPPRTVRPIFDLPVFTGCKDEFNLSRPGKQVFHGACYYLPMLFTYLGARRNEFAGLAANDIIETENGPAIHIRKNAFRGIKNAQSDRMLPILDELLRLGFLDYVAAVKRLGHQQLFPELYSPNLKTNDPGDRFYKDFIPLLKTAPDLADGLWDRTIHAFRHGLADTLKQSGVELGIIDDLSGRLGFGETQIRYTNPAGLPLLREKLRTYPVITNHLEPRPIHLLPWVVSKDLPPWAGRSPGDRFRKPKKP
ncbi:integrase [Consotaella aegiceratis]|uniref:integrase n=1 Tax=Consotaella aegiceratis TaxID=3097961 RepID=UPI002F4204C2